MGHILEHWPSAVAYEATGWASLFYADTAFAKHLAHSRLSLARCDRGNQAG